MIDKHKQYKLQKYQVPYGNKLYAHSCLKCHNDWIGTTETPTRCKFCGSYDWDKSNGSKRKN